MNPCAVWLLALSTGIIHIKQKVNPSIQPSHHEENLHPSLQRLLMVASQRENLGSSTIKNQVPEALCSMNSSEHRVLSTDKKRAKIIIKDKMVTTVNISIMTY